MMSRSEPAGAAPAPASAATTPAPSASAAGARRNRALFLNFFRRELATRYLGSVTGLAWAVLHPVMLLGVYWFVFTHVFRVAGFGGKSFIAFVAIALWPWLAAQDGLTRATVSLGQYAGLIRKVAFPNEIAVYASVAATLALQFAGYVTVLAVLALAGEPIRFEGLLLAIPVWIVIAIAVTGLGLALASLQVFVRDVEHVLSPLLMILMYLTPILYPLSAVPETLRGYVAANPFGWIVTRLRDCLLDGDFALHWSDAGALAAAVAIFAAGRWMFVRLSPYFEDFV